MLGKAEDMPFKGCSVLGLSGSLKGPVKSLMSTFCDPSMILVRGTQGIPLHLVIGHTSTQSNNNTKQPEPRTLSVLNIGLQRSEKADPLQNGVTRGGFVEKHHLYLP